MLDDRNDNEKYVPLPLTKIFCNLFGLGTVFLISVVVVDVWLNPLNFNLN